MDANSLHKYFDDLEASGRTTAAGRGYSPPIQPYNPQGNTIQMRPDDEMPEPFHGKPIIRDALPTYEVDDGPQFDLTDQMDEGELTAHNKLAQEEDEIISSPEFLAEYKAEKDRFMDEYGSGLYDESAHNDTYLRKAYKKWSDDKKAKEERYRRHPDSYGYFSTGGSHHLMNPKSREWEKFPHARKGGSWQKPTDSYYLDRDRIQADLRNLGADPDRGLGRKQKNKMLIEGLGPALNQPIPGLVTGQKPQSR